jgi:pilus assembly protein CpaC
MGSIRNWMIALFMVFYILLPISMVQAADGVLSVAVNQSQVLNFNGVERVAVANPEVADVVVVSGYEILLVGKAPGTTTLHVWSASGRKSYNVEVNSNDAQLAGEIKSILGYPDIKVSKVNKNVILEGSVNDQYQKLRAEKVASAYGEKVINLLEINRPVQVKIEARIIEIDKKKTDNLGLVWGNSTSSPGVFTFGQSITNTKMGSSTFGNLGGYTDVLGQLNALLINGSAQILSQPNVITLSGESANIMIGGQIPIPVSNQNGSVTIEWKDFGIKLEISPEVNGERLINSKIKAEVSSIDWASDHKIPISTTLSIPPINIRKAETAIALSSGQTMAIGGLIANETDKAVTKFPILADIPILGKLFTSTAFTKNETELVILITPTIVDPKEYVPNLTTEMKDASKENPWGGK